MKKIKLATDKKGFTLVELLVVMVIIGLLATLIGPKLFPQLGKAKQDTAKTQIDLLGQGLDTFKLDVGRYPTTQEGLNALITNPGLDKWNGPYAKKKQLIDPWDRPYQYLSPGTHYDYDLISFGRDGVPGGEKEDRDVVNWE